MQGYAFREAALRLINKDDALSFPESPWEREVPRAIPRSDSARDQCGEIRGLS